MRGIGYMRMETRPLDIANTFGEVFEICSTRDKMALKARAAKAASVPYTILLGQKDSQSPLSMIDERIMRKIIKKVVS